MSARALALLIAPILWLAAGTASGDTPQLYDVSVGPGTVKTLDTVSNAMLTVHLDAGPDASGGTETVCQDGIGDELCAIDVTFEVNGPGQIVGFSPPGAGPLVIYHPFPFTPTTKLRINLLTSMAPHVLGPTELGMLTLDLTGASQANPSKVEASGQVVDAAGELQTIPLQTIAIPEPSHTWLLVSGLLGLGLLYRLRGSGRQRGTRGSSP